MQPSFERINYQLRPAKNVQRKMISDALRKLESFAKLRTYTYVGFGSPYFSDFSLFHKGLGISKMISIEKFSRKRRRFDFNRPYRCIELEYGLSTEKLPGLPWKAGPMVLWLDYDGEFGRTAVSDVSIFVTHAVSGSMVLVTHETKPPAPLDQQPLAKLKQDIGWELLPRGLRDTDLVERKAEGVYRQVLENTITETLADRNGGRGPDKRYSFKQVFNFRYKDGSARMMTVGWVLFEVGDKEQLNSCEFEDLEFIRSGKRPYEIDVPKLTFREITYLASQLPLRTGEQLSAEAVPAQDLRAYERIYRYFPNFVEVEF